MALSAAEIGAVTTEIRPALLGGWIQKIFQPSEWSILLEIRTPGRTLLLQFNVHPETARIHIQRRRVANPVRPPQFCQLLRARIQGARLESIHQQQGERIVECELHAKGSRHFLIAELVGRGANLLLLDQDRTILATLRPAPERLRTTYRPLAQAPKQAADPERQRFFPSPSAASTEEFPFSTAIDAYYGARDLEAEHATARRERAAAVRRWIKKLLRRLDALELDREKARRYQPFARYGELLKANLGHLRKGQEEATVIDYFDEALPTLLLPLDPAKTPQSNMEHYFQRYRKHLTAEREITPRLTATKQELERLQEEQRAIERGDWQPVETTRAATHARKPRSSARKAGPAHDRQGPFRRFTSSDGLPIYVGRNAKENEELTHRFAKSEDLWLHAQGMPGSHVVVRLAKGADVPPETLRDAATLALHYSDLRKSGKGDVIYTRKKWVRKAKGHAAGAVLVTQEQSIYLQLDRSRLDRLRMGTGAA